MVPVIIKIMFKHLSSLYQFYGETRGVRIARKHIAWYSKGMRNSATFRNELMQAQTINQQKSTINRYLIDTGLVA